MVTSNARTWTLLDTQKLLGVRISVFDISVYKACCQFVGPLTCLHFPACAAEGRCYGYRIPHAFSVVKNPLSSAFISDVITSK